MKKIFLLLAVVVVIAVAVIFSSARSSAPQNVSFFTSSPGSFQTPNIWKTIDNDGKEWIVDYSAAEYAESYIDMNGKTVYIEPKDFRYKDFDAAMAAMKAYDGGRGGWRNTRVIGVLGKDGVVRASKIVIHRE